jgi:menaquinone-dependent protoporphyrinogen oxidase
MDTILVAYATKYGATAEIANKISSVLEKNGLEAEAKDINTLTDLEDFKAIVIGSAVYYGKWRKEAVRFVVDNSKKLAEKKVWIFSCGPTGEGEPLELTKGWRVPTKIEAFADEIEPKDIALFHGKIEPSEVNGFEKWIIKRVKAPVGDYRNWKAITDWTHEIIKEMKNNSDKK